MKQTFAILIWAFILCSLCGIEVGGIGLSAVSHDGFTIRWEEVPGAIGYDLELRQGLEKSHDFDASGFLPDTWDHNGAFIYTYEPLAHSGTNILIINKQGYYVTSPLLQNPGIFSFYARSATTANQSATFTLKMQISSDALNWSDIGSLIAPYHPDGNVSTVYKKFFFSLNLSGSYYVRLFMEECNHSYILIDDLQYTELDSTDLVSTAYTEDYAYRAHDLNPDTNYLIRIKPDLEDGDYSDWQALKTNPANGGTSAGTSINGQAAVMNVSPDFGISLQQLSVIPNETGIFDYSLSAEEIPGAFSYTISCANSAALNGQYTISHPGITVTGCSVSDGDITDYASATDHSSFLVSGIAGKGSLQIVLHRDETLPVQITSFTAEMVGAGVCRLSWISQSESMMHGYKILRSPDAQLSQAEPITPLIVAENSSQPREYVYLDEDVTPPLYYWLRASFYDGDEQDFGPVLLDIEGTDNPGIVFQRNHLSIYPNPFNYTANLALNLKESSIMQFEIYNLRGQLIRGGSLGNCEPGETKFLLKAVDAEGKALQSGIYFLRLQGDGISFMQRLMVMR
jgi:hypothetical protein